jgi:valyl-tRNA synthetase
MTAHQIIETVTNHAERYEFNATETLMVQRYFIHKFCAWMPLRAIAELTKATNHSTCKTSIQCVETQDRFRYFVHFMTGHLQQYIK